MLDASGPSIAVARKRARRSQFDRGRCAVQTADQLLPGNIDPQIFRLVNDLRAVCENDDFYRTASVVRIGEATFDLNDSALRAGLYGAANKRQVDIKPLDEFASGFDPLPDNGADQPQQHRLFLEKLAESAGPHLGHEFFVQRRRRVLPESRSFAHVPHC